MVFVEVVLVELGVVVLVVTVVADDVVPVVSKIDNQMKSDVQLM